jgi:F-type H+-transporting ATPase subunit delta
VAGVPGRYASALFELAAEENAVEPVGAALASFQAAIDAAPDLRRLVRSPVYRADDQIAAIAAIASELGIAGTALKFLKLVARNRRLAAISDIVKAYHTLLATSKGEIAAEVVSAEALAERHVDDIKSALKASMGREVQLATRVDPAILGGLVVKVGSRMIDNSLKTKLANLKIAMKGTA